MLRKLGSITCAPTSLPRVAGGWGEDRHPPTISIRDVSRMPVDCQERALQESCFGLTKRPILRQAPGSPRTTGSPSTLPGTTARPLGLPARQDERLTYLNGVPESLFDREARTYNVYPTADDLRELLTADQPVVVSGDQRVWSARDPASGGRGHQHREPAALTRPRGRESRRSCRRHARYARRSRTASMCAMRREAE